MTTLKMNQVFGMEHHSEARRITLRERLANYFRENKDVIVGGLAALNRNVNAYTVYKKR